MRVKFNIINGYYKLDNESIHENFDAYALIEQLNKASKIIVEWYNTDEYQSTEDAALFQDQLRKECGLAFCTKHDCENEFNTDFRTFDIKEIYG
jgi:hypothetical protein